MTKLQPTLLFHPNLFSPLTPQYINHPSMLAYSYAMENFILDFGALDPGDG